MNGFWLFFTRSGWFLGLGIFQNMFLNLLIYTNNFWFGYIAVSCFFETFPAGWVAGWQVGKSDFNESPVVSPDLDLDFGLRLRVCQKHFTSILLIWYKMCWRKLIVFVSWQLGTIANPWSWQVCYLFYLLKDKRQKNIRIDTGILLNDYHERKTAV